MCSVTSQGRPHARLRRALATGNPLLVRAAAAEMQTVGLEDALAICLVLLDSERGSYEPAAVRWLGRVLLEQPGLSLAAAETAAADLGALRERGRTQIAARSLSELCEQVGLGRAAEALRERPWEPQPPR
jgi:hypothetical protein